jgi:hypothetical protein
VSYRSSVTGGTSLPGSTAIVLLTTALTGDLASEARGWVYATNSAGTFTFYDGNGAALVALPVTLTTIDAAAILGDPILIDRGANDWRQGIITSDGTSYTTPAGTAIPLTARAIAKSDLVGYTDPPAGRFSVAPGVSYTTSPPSEVFNLIGLTVGGAPQFGCTRLALFYGATSLTTLGALTAGTEALVEVGGAWHFLTF